MVICAICGAAGTRFSRIRHRDLGIILVCGACREREKERLLPLSGRNDCCGCR